jgi:hypothetical protein
VPITKSLRPGCTNFRDLPKAEVVDSAPKPALSTNSWPQLIGKDQDHSQISQNSLASDSISIECLQLSGHDPLVGGIAEPHIERAKIPHCAQTMISKTHQKPV